ncbi:MAG TPA: aldo/keto reductase [Planctomycetota bacterium]|nr:aldo/keto reductase [Planctomycetota bacterium]
MLYRRFGKTNLQMPVFSCGGMRYQQSWNDKDKFTPENQKNLEACIHRSLEVGINHIETARGYGTSEEQLGHVLPKLPREKMIVQTKIGPEADPKKFNENFDKSMSLLKLDYVDLLAIHGINNEERLEWSLRKGGCLEQALALKKQGRARHVGFSTHGSLQVILEAIKDGRFEYVNLHWYYVNQFNWPAVELATKLDMGVFIISPSDKGGKLYEPSKKLVQMTDPLSPIVFNDLWCLTRPQIHTLSVGAARPTDFDEHLKTLQFLKPGVDAQAILKPIETRMQSELVKTLGEEWVKSWHVGIPEWNHAPGEVNIFEILRLRNFAKAFDMIEYGKMRYNLLGKADHWFPGNRADNLKGLDFSMALKNSPFAKEIPAALAEAHELMAGQEVKRLGSH